MTPFATERDLWRRTRRRSPRSVRPSVIVIHVEFTLAELIVSDALVRSYPTWTDENGTNVHQLAQIAIRALAEQGLLAPAAEGDRIAVLDASGTGATR